MTLTVRQSEELEERSRRLFDRPEFHVSGQPNQVVADKRNNPHLPVTFNEALTALMTEVAGGPFITA